MFNRRQKKIVSTLTKAQKSRLLRDDPQEVKAKPYLIQVMSAEEYLQQLAEESDNDLDRAEDDRESGMLVYL